MWTPKIRGNVRVEAKLAAPMPRSFITTNSGTVGCVRSREVLMRRLLVITAAAGNESPLTTNEGDSQASKKHLLL
jgi:hypothetical protein